jgi:hypothetical protein
VKSQAGNGVQESEEIEGARIFYTENSEILVQKKAEEKCSRKG